MRSRTDLRVVPGGGQDRLEQSRRPAVRVRLAQLCAHCQSARHPTSAHEDLGEALLAVKRSLRAGRYHEAEAFVDVARKLAGGRG